MQFVEPSSPMITANRPSTDGEAFEFLESDDSALMVLIDGLAAAREIFVTLPAIRRGESVLISHYNADAVAESEQCMWEIADDVAGQPVLRAISLDQMRFGSVSDLFFEAAVLAEGTGNDLLALFHAIQENVRGSR